MLISIGLCSEGLDAPQRLFLFFKQKDASTLYRHDFLISLESLFLVLLQ